MAVARMKRVQKHELLATAHTEKAFLLTWAAFDS